jgi:fibronectin-binding autotransporter adhesin
MNRHGSMNHIYRLVWSPGSNSWVPVAETTRGLGKGSRRTLAAAALSLLAGAVQAGPLGGQVVVGAGTITQSGATTTITQASQNLSLNWKSFNIAPQETVDFVQPSVTSVAVNRIFDINGTQILGHLNANGQVYLINPNGIVFGRGAEVDVGGLVASTLNLNDPTFGTDTKSFSGSGTGSIVNYGTIKASGGGYVALLGNTASNQGVISAQLGSVALGAGSAATLTFAGNHLVHMQVDASVLNSLADNSGVIRADGGQVLMTAGAKDALLASVVNNTGVIEANTVENRGGSIALTGGMQAGQVIVKGTLEASSTTGQGGEIVATGDTVLVGDGARVDATGATGGGTIAIGGGWEGGGGIAQATAVYVSKTATLDASASATGNGGEVVVRSDVNDPDSATRVYGTLLAEGGAKGGNGGRIETSGHWLDVSGIVADASATSGLAGEWLLDPYNVIIGSTTAGNGYTPPNFSPSSSDSTILASTISTALTGGNNVTITTGSSGSSLGDITVNTAITKTAGSAATLTLQAADSIIINQPITNTSSAGKLNVDLWADNDNGTHDGVGVVILNSSISTAGGAVAFGTGATQSINGVPTLVGGDLYVGGTSAVSVNTAGGQVDIHGQLIIANSNGFNINSGNGNVNFDGLVDSGDSYSFVTQANVTWTQALSEAKSGIGANVGDTYLATITSRLENSVAGAAAGYVASWLGAERVTGIGTDAIWRWVTGPEGLQNNGKGLEFFTQNGSETTNGSGGTAIGGAYVNWNPATPEPNNSGGANLSASGQAEWVMQFVGTQGQWNDLNPSNALTGYVKETNLAQSPLNITAGTGVVTFAQALGSNKPLVSLNVTAQTIALNSPTVNTSGGQTFTGQVTVDGADVNLLTVSANNLTTTYGTGVPTLSSSYSGFVNGDTAASLTTPATVATTASASPNVGSYPITASGVVDPTYYIIYNPGTLIVNLATLNVTASSASRTYGQANPTLSVSYSGFQYSDTSSILTTPAQVSTTATTSSNVGGYATTASGAATSSGNYTIGYTNGTLTVNPAPLTVTGLSGTGRAYNGSSSDALMGTASLIGLLNSQTLTLSNATSGTLASANAGSETVTTAITLTDGSGLANNYTLTQPTLANVTITPAPLTVSGLSGTGRTYNGATLDALTGTGTLAGLQNGETLGLGAVTGTLASANAGSEAVTTSITLINGSGAAGNYVLTQPTLANVTIAQAPLTVGGTVASGKVYDGTTTATLTLGSLDGLVLDDAVTLTQAGHFASANVGTGIAVTAADTLGGAAALNYSLTQPTGLTANITQLASVVWIGPATGGSWSNPANWAGGAIPDLSNVANVIVPPGDNVVFNSSVPGPVNLTNLSSGGLTMDSGTLNVSTALNLANYAQSGGTVGGTGSFTVTNAFSQTAGQIAMSPGPVTITQALGNLSFADISAGAVALNSTTGGVTLGQLTTTGDLAVTALGGTITQSVGSSLAVAGTTALDASDGGAPANITVANVGNSLVRAVNASGAQIGLTDTVPLTLGLVDAGGNLTLASTGALDLGTSTVGGNLLANSGNGNITQDGPLAVTGTTGIVAGTGDIQLSNAGNTLAQAVSASGAQIGLTDAGPLTLGAVDASGNLTLASTGALDLGTSTVGGNLLANSGNGNVTQDGALSVSGTTAIVAGTGNIQLANTGNMLAQAVSASGAQIGLTDAGPLTLGTVDASGNLTLASTGALDLGTSAVGGSLLANSGNGNVTQDGPLAVTGTTGIAAGTGNIQLGNAGNTLAQTVNASGAQVGLTDAGPLTLGAVDASGNLTLASTGALDLGTSTVGGNLLANSGNGNVTQDGALAVTGTTGIVAGTGNIQLGNAGNTLAQAVSASGAQIGLTDAGPLTLGSVDAGGNLILASAGALDLGTSIVGGNLAANSGNGNVTQDGALAVTGTTGIVAGTGNIQLTNSANTLAQTVSASGRQVGLTDAGPLTLGTADASGNLTLASTGALDLGTSTVGGNLAANSGNGNVTQDGALAVTGTTGIVAGTGNIQLSNAGNTLARAVSASGRRVRLTDAGPLTLGTVDATDNLTLISTGALDLGTATVGGKLAANSGNGDITQSGALSVSGTTSIVAGTGSIQLKNLHNDFQDLVLASGDAVDIGGDFPLNASARYVVSQLESSSPASDAGTQSSGLSLSSPTFNAIPSAGSDASAGNEASLVPDSGKEDGVDVTQNIGTAGPTLKIVNGGVRLPNHTVNVYE